MMQHAIAAVAVSCLVPLSQGNGFFSQPHAQDTDINKGVGRVGVSVQTR